MVIFTVIADAGAVVQNTAQLGVLIILGTARYGQVFEAFHRVDWVCWCVDACSTVQQQLALNDQCVQAQFKNIATWWLHVGEFHLQVLVNSLGGSTVLLLHIQLVNAFEHDIGQRGKVELGHRGHSQRCITLSKQQVGLVNGLKKL